MEGISEFDVEYVEDDVVELTFWKLIIGLQLTRDVEKFATTIGKLKKDYQIFNSNLKVIKKNDYIFYLTKWKKNH